MENGSRASLLLDDFSNPDGRSLIGTFLAGLHGPGHGRPIKYASLEGPQRVTNRLDASHARGCFTGHNGGFIQVRLPLSDEGKGFDGSRYQGVVLMVRGMPGKYAVHLRTPANHAPWSYYGAALPVSETWARVELPFSQFKGTFLTSRFNPQNC
jgi:hypothetical protein